MEIVKFFGHLIEVFIGILMSMFSFCLIIVAVYILWVALAVVVELAKRRYRRYKNDERIIRQAKAMGVWNTNAGGRALELYAKECGVQRLAGETDAHLRIRIRKSVENADGCHE